MLTFSINPNFKSVSMEAVELCNEYGVKNASSYLIDRMVSRGVIQPTGILNIKNLETGKYNTNIKTIGEDNDLDKPNEEASQGKLTAPRVEDFQDEVVDTLVVEDMLKKFELLDKYSECLQLYKYVALEIASRKMEDGTHKGGKRAFSICSKAVSNITTTLDEFFTGNNVKDCLTPEMVEKFIKRVEELNNIAK